ncbi:MAG: alpha/beta fold hydrolase [Anaerolineae bacterium]|nr:alpha/beta fold hydrolase [Anaerolineae bacterium]
MKRSILFILFFSILLLGACTTTAETPAAVSDAAPEVQSEEETEVMAAETVVAETVVAATAVPTATQPAPTEAPTIAPTPEPVETEEPVILGEIVSEDIVVEAADGLELAATFYAADGLENAPAILLLHMLGSNRTIWETVGLVDELTAKGYAVLALDMRGHGETGNAQDWVLAEDDIQRVWHYFVDRPEVDAGRTAVIGASIGSNMALIAAANEPTMRTAILLSPGLVYRGVSTEDRMPDYGERPLLIVASEDDYYSEDSAHKLAETAVGETQVQIYEKAGHGTDMFEPQPDLTPLILDWLATHLGN